MAHYGIKAGSNINTNTDQLLDLTSKFSTLKAFKWGNAQFTTDGSGNGSVTIAHGLDYPPIVAVMKKFTAQYTFLSATTYPDSFHPLNEYNGYADGNGYGFFYTTDEDNLYITSVGGSSGVSVSTTYYFRYMIFVDLSDTFSNPSNISLTGDYGFKISKPGVNVLTGQEYEMALSSKYKMLQYYDGHILSSSLTLPAMFASKYDSYEEEATYVDFNHSLEYPPFFLAFSNFGGSSLYELPKTDFDPAGGGNYYGLTTVSPFCDDNKVRVLFKRVSQTVGSSTYGTVFNAATISIIVVIFAENLIGEESP